MQVSLDPGVPSFSELDYLSEHLLLTEQVIQTLFFISTFPDVHNFLPTSDVLHFHLAMLPAAFVISSVPRRVFQVFWGRRCLFWLPFWQGSRSLRHLSGQVFILCLNWGPLVPPEFASFGWCCDVFPLLTFCEELVLSVSVDFSTATTAAYVFFYFFTGCLHSFTDILIH